MRRAIIIAALLSTFALRYSEAADLQKGKTLFEQRCSSCHGLTGAGDGPIGAALPPEQKPRNLAEAKWKFATDDTKMKELLKKGGAAVGLSPLMPMQPDLGDADLDSIIAFIESLAKK